MTMKILTAQTNPDSIHFDVWMDTTKTDASGNPDPSYVRPFDYGKTYPPGVSTDQEYQNWMTADMQKIVDAELLAKSPPDPYASMAGQTM